MALEYLLKLGYTKKDAENIINTYPLNTLYDETLFRKIKDVYDWFIEQRYSKEEIIKMTKILPTIFGFSIENIKQKVDLYRSLNLEFIVLNDTKNLMQSSALTYARYTFYQTKGITINESNYRLLFMVQKQFEQRFGLTKNELLEMYNYEETLSLKNKKK